MNRLNAKISIIVSLVIIAFYTWIYIISIDNPEANGFAILDLPVVIFYAFVDKFEFIRNAKISVAGWAFTSIVIWNIIIRLVLHIIFYVKKRTTQPSTPPHQINP